MASDLLIHWSGAIVIVARQHGVNKGEVVRIVASIRERSSRGQSTWAVLYRQGSRQTSKTFDSRPAAAHFKALVELLGPDRALVEIQNNGSKDERLTVDELATLFLDWKQRDVTARTMTDYRRDYAKWIKPQFGHRAAELIDESDVQKWVDSMARTLSPKSVGDRHMLLHSMFAFGKARSRNLVGHNPCLETDMPKRTKKPPKGTTIAEWGALLDAASVRNPDAGDLILFLGSLGWRWSEAAALAVRDVEDDGQSVWVDVTRVFRIINNRQVLVEDAAKSFAGFRRSRVPSDAAAMFRRRLIGRPPSDFVFTNTRGNHWNQTTFLRDTWPALVRDAGIGSPTRKPTPHWLRHMAVANMARAGIPMHEIQRVIGHENITTTNTTYGGTVSTLSMEAIPSLDAVLATRRSAALPGQIVRGSLA